MYITMLKRVSISFLLGLMVFSLLSFPALATPSDTTAPAFTGAESGSYGSNVYLTFDENIFINSEDDSYEGIETLLRDQLSIATDGLNYFPILERSQLYIANNQIYIGYYNNVPIILGTDTLIKIAAGTIKDEFGNLNAEMILQVSTPAIQNVEISDDNHDVTVTYNVYVFEGTPNGLKDDIQLVKGGVWKSLVSTDTATIVDGKLHIHFTEALSGTDNQISIDGYAVKDSFGNVDRDRRTTATIQVNVGGIDPNPADTTIPKFIGYYFSNDNKDFSLVFDEDVFNAHDNIDSFKQNVQYYSNGVTNESLPENSTITFSEEENHTVTIHFEEPLIGNYFYFSFNNGHFKDAAGNTFNFETGGFYPSTMNYQGGYFSNDGRWMSLELNVSDQLLDLTIEGGVSHLHDAITISLDRGISYVALDPLDVVSIQGKRIVVLFHEKKDVGIVKVRIAANVLSDYTDSIHNPALDVEVANNTPDLKGYMFTNTASEFVFEANATWNSSVRDIYIYDTYYGTERRLDSSEYTLTAGKLTFINGLFQENHKYYITINALGYSNKYLEGVAHKTADIFYITTPVVTRTSGITASISLFNNVAQDYYYYSDYLNATSGTQTVIFQLMNGDTPVSIVASELIVSTGTYTVNFNVLDASNSNYTVRAFVVSKYSNNSADVGLNLATVQSQNEIDLLIESTKNTSNNDQ